MKSKSGTGTSIDDAPGDNADESHCLVALIGGALLVILMPGAQAQGVVNYPPADGMMYAPAPVFPAPGGFGGNYAQTYPSNVAGGVLRAEPERLSAAGRPGDQPGRSEGPGTGGCPRNPDL